MNKKNNSRAQASRHALQQAMLKLLDKQELSEITITQLCREAAVNRSTFYAHYENLWDVMNELEDEMDSEFLAQFQWVKDSQDAMLDKRSFLIVTHHIALHPAFYRARLNNSSLQAGRYKTGMEYLVDKIIQPYAMSVNNTPLLSYFIAFGRAGIIEVLNLWICNGCRESAQDIADLLYNITIKRLLVEGI